jgi:hypothetical protein
MKVIGSLDNVFQDALKPRSDAEKDVHYRVNAFSMSDTSWG